MDPRALRAAFGAFPTGVTVVTTRDDGGAPVGFTANSFSSVSLDPPMLLVCPGRFLSSFEVFACCRRFAVSILAEGQERVSNVFASFKGDRFAQVAWRPDAHGMPLIDGASAHFSCDTAQVMPAGDHVILIGAVRAFEASGAPGLGYSEGQYFSLGLERAAAAAPAKGQRAFAGAIIERGGRVLLEDAPEGRRPLQVALGARTQVRRALEDHLARSGLKIALGNAYSVFDDHKSGAHFTFFRGTAFDDATGGCGRYAPIGSLSEMRFASPGVASMMRRYAAEHAAGDFTLYVGNEAAGDHHPLGGD